MTAVTSLGVSLITAGFGYLGMRKKAAGDVVEELAAKVKRLELEIDLCEKKFLACQEQNFRLMAKLLNVEKGLSGT